MIPSSPIQALPKAASTRASSLWLLVAFGIFAWAGLVPKAISSNELHPAASSMVAAVTATLDGMRFRPSVNIGNSRTDADTGDDHEQQCPICVANLRIADLGMLPFSLAACPADHPARPARYTLPTPRDPPNA